MACDLMPDAVSWVELKSLTRQQALGRHSSKELASAFQAAMRTPEQDASVLAFEVAVDWRFEGLSTVSVLDWTSAYASAGRGVQDAVLGWDYQVRRALCVVAQSEPKALTEHPISKRKQLSDLVGFCLAVAGKQPWPAAVLERVAMHYLNAAPKLYAFSELVPLEVVAEAAGRVFAERTFPVLQYARLEALLPYASDELKLQLALNYCGQDFRNKASQLLTEQASRALKFFENTSALARLPPGALISGALFLATQGQHEHPFVEQGLRLDLSSGVLDDLDVSLAAFRELPHEVAKGLIQEYLKESRASALVAAVADPELIEVLLERALAGKLDKSRAISALVACGEVAANVIAKAPLGKAPSSTRVNIVAEVLTEHPTDAGNLRLVEFLGLGSASASQAAERALEKIGEGARVQLEEAKSSSKKKVRDAAERLLNRLEHKRAGGVETPVSRARERAAACSAEERNAFLELCEELKGTPHLWPARLRPRVLHRGELVLEWLRPQFEESVAAGEASLWCFVVEQLATEPDAVWVAVDCFARLPKLPTVLWARPRRALLSCGDLLTAPIAYQLQYETSEHREALFRMLAKHADERAHKVLIDGLADNNKMIRTHCVDGLSRLSEIKGAELVPLLGSGDVGTRIATCELLAVWGQEDSKDSLIAALNEEKSAKVRPYLEEAWISAGGLAQMLGLAEGISDKHGSWLNAVDSFLQAQKPPKKLPPFLQHEALPELRYRDGQILGERATLGFLRRAMMLEPTLKGRLLRALRPAFDQEALNTWSKVLHERWQRAKDSRHRWAVLQMWLFADEHTIDQVGRQIAQLRSTEHVAISAYLKVLQWHPHPVALNWLCYWAEHLRSRGLREQAQELMSRVAFKEGRSVASLRAATDCFIGEDHLSAEFLEQPVNARSQARLVQHLERSLRSGYAFTKAQLDGLLTRYLGERPNLLLHVQDEIMLPTDEGWRAVEEHVRVRLAHPLLMSDAQLERARLQLAEQELWVEQTERSVFVAGTPQDLALSNLDTDTQAFEQWRRDEGWLHGEPLDQGVVHANSLRLPGFGVVAEIHHTGYPIGAHDWVDKLFVLELRFFDLDGHELDEDQVPPIVYSEICRSLSLMAKKS